jgi:glycosyltransferase involved in cell wall biosynthesis
MGLPSISIVTPSYNQGQFLGATLESVLGQRYPALEYLVMDGGSEDDSVELIKQRESGLAFWRSEPDQGQAAAINEGFSRSSGKILGWLNSDDLYTTETFSQASAVLGPVADQPFVLYGSCELVYEGKGSRRIRVAPPFDSEMLQITDYFDQPAVFWTRAAWNLVGPLDESLHYAFDWDWFLRAAGTCKFLQTESVLARYRLHPRQKSGVGGKNRWTELVEVARRHSPKRVIDHYLFLSNHPVTHWWLNKRMRLAQVFRGMLPAKIAETLATAASPPFWHLPEGIDPQTLWLISGIR